MGAKLRYSSPSGNRSKQASPESGGPPSRVQATLEKIAEEDDLTVAPIVVRLPRLLVMSSRARNKLAMYASVLPGVVAVEYSYESDSLHDILWLVRKSLTNPKTAAGPQGKVASVAFVLHTSERELFLCSSQDIRINIKTIISNNDIRDFFVQLCKEHLWDTGTTGSARMDFLATYCAEHIDGGLISRELQNLLGCRVGFSKDLEGEDLSSSSSSTSSGRFPLALDLMGKVVALSRAGQLYFDRAKLQVNLNNVGRVNKDGLRKLQTYEKIRVVGKGAFGNAVLYRRPDASLCIIKEINMLDLTATDRQMSLNEVKVLSQMDHPNIVAYYDSFERDGVLMIEMEYANGGNLAEFLNRQTSYLDEKVVVELAFQMVSATRYMHAHKVLHRDLKTANIFLTTEGLVKIGDFGISKTLTTRAANTVLGTPYYISPEMCEGKSYGEKSDVWALGCILYEMACLQKTFEGSNLPALVNKIVRGQFAPIQGPYSAEYKQLVRDMLQREPDFRPTASDIMLKYMPALLAAVQRDFRSTVDGIRDGGDLPVDDDEDGQEDIEDVVLMMNGRPGAATNNNNNNPFQLGSEKVPRQSRPSRSVLYQVKELESGLLTLMPVQLPPTVLITQVSISGSHTIALTNDHQVFTWGEGDKGQLGHGELEAWRPKPHLVEALRSTAVTKVAAGDGFSVFSSDNGILMTCGDGTLGCLGHRDWQSRSIPRLVEALLSVDVSAIACGSEHVVVVGSQGEVFSWGRGTHGRLGLGHEDDCCTPQEVKLDTGVDEGDQQEETIVNVKCQGAATILLANSGLLYACGHNLGNRLGLEEGSWFWWPSSLFDRNPQGGGDGNNFLTPLRVKSLRHRVVDLAMGPFHTVCLTEQGKVVTMGLNPDGQLGRGNTQSHPGPAVVKSMADSEVTLVAAGTTFTVVGTNENVVYFWGTKQFSAAASGSPSWKRKSMPKGDAAPADFHPIPMDLSNSSFATVTSTASSNSLARMAQTLPQEPAAAGRSLRKPGRVDVALRDVILEPQEVLALYASQKSVSRGETVILREIYCQGHQIFLLVETTCPLRNRHKQRLQDHHQGLEVAMDVEEAAAAAAAADGTSRTLGTRTGGSTTVPEWLRAEIDASEATWRSQPGSTNSSAPRWPKRANSAAAAAAAAAADQRHFRRLEQEYDRKRRELLLEAENAVRAREDAYNRELRRLNQELQKQREQQEAGRQPKGSSPNGQVRPKDQQQPDSLHGCTIQ